MDDSNTQFDNLKELDCLGEILRTNNFRLSIMYGSGGYCTMITHNKKQYLSFSYDIQKSIIATIKKAIDGKEVKTDNKTISD